MSNNINSTKSIRHSNRKASSGMVTTPTVWDIIADIIIATLLFFVALACVIPLWHVLMASISDGKAMLGSQGIIWKPVGKATLEGYRLLFRDASILSGYANTLIYVVGATSIGMFLNILGGYVMSRTSRLRGFLVLFVMFTMMFNGGLIPTYTVVRNLGLTGTRWSLLIPGCTVAVFMMLMMNAFRSVPESTVEAAYLDGAGHFRTMLQVMLPQTGGITIVVILNSVILHWNAWFNASIYIPNNRDLWPLQLWIRQIVADNANLLQNANPDYNRFLIQYAVIVAATLPVLAAFPFFQKRLEKGVITGAVKG